MKIITANTYEEMSGQVADDLIRTMQLFNEPLLCPASGSTPVGLYKELVNLYRQKKFDPSNWLFVALDEWVGMDGNKEGSCKHSLDEQLFNPLKIKADQICFFDGKADLDKECDRVEKFIRQHGGIDVSVLGLGMNGHVGMNEPYTPASLRSHIAKLDPVTQQVGQKYFKERQHLSEGVTLGLATLLESKHIFLLVNGERKAGIVKKVIEGNITEEMPATILRRHTGLKVYLDADAAQLIQQ
ncbi:MAG TPA: glucosamine-6-phosphate deaminase [Chitinophagaceae bacterium]|jgi:galactosamine-6-phosphate isomerase